MSISIITASLNPSSHPRGVNIDGLLKSTAGQVGAVEHLVVDAGSTDGTQEVVNSYAHATLISAPGSTLFEAFNIGIDMAHGDWVYFIGGDDRLVANNVLDLALQTTGYASVVHARIAYGAYPAEIPNPRIEAWLHRRDVLLNLGKFNIGNKFYADCDLHRKKRKLGLFPKKSAVVLAVMATGGHASRAKDELS